MSKAARKFKGDKGEPTPLPSDEESAAIEAARARKKARTPRVNVCVKQDKSGCIVNVGPEHADVAGWLVRLEDALGSTSRAFAISQLNEMIKASQSAGNEIDNSRLNAMIAIVEGASPTNELQAALAVQMAITHFAVLTVTRRALRVDQIPQFDSAGNMAVKLARTFALQAEALAKLQRGGEQVVKVVHVHPGAQAIVGNVHQGQGGGSNESGSQPHAKALTATGSASIMSPMWSTDADREPMPVPGGFG